MRTFLTVALVFFLLPAAAAEEGCLPEGRYAFLVLPRNPLAGQPFRVLVAAEEPLGELSLSVGSGGRRVVGSVSAQGGGPPFWAVAEFPGLEAGGWRLEARQAGGGRLEAGAETNSERERAGPWQAGGGRLEAGAETNSERERAGPQQAGGGRLEAGAEARQAGETKTQKSRQAWAVEQEWTWGTEALYSAWLEHLFAVPEGTSWTALHEVTRVPERNLLHEYLDLGEDDGKGPNAFDMVPDCADNPYFLRAYFAWKLGLPFGFHRCDRGRPGRPPRCAGWTTQATRRAKGSEGRAFYRFLRQVKSAIHSSSARTALDSDAADLYPVALTTAALRPGIVFADPYGHTLMLVSRVRQTDSAPGQLLAVDAQPDGTVTVKRFWRGNFLFANEEVIGGPGFKAFRPLRRVNGEWAPVPNADLRPENTVAPFSLDQMTLSVTAFYDAMEQVINPAPLDPVAAFRQLHEALYEQVLTRVTAVANGERYMAAHPGTEVSMPDGVAIFQTSGPWEDFSTPARDMRLLVALDTLADFPDRLLRIPDAFLLPEGRTPAQVAQELRTLSGQWATEYRFAYVTSSGAKRELTLADLVDRAKALEVAYNPNDCPEVRWGAPEGSGERRGCTRRAPREQRSKMERYRPWFSSRRRPAWD
jgi:hypothetical protein